MEDSSAEPEEPRSLSRAGAPLKPWHGVHKALADPLRIRLLEWLAEAPRSARQLAGCAGLPADPEPPGDDADPEETAAFLGSMLQATAMDITAAYQARQAGRHREVDLHRGALRLTDQALAELRGHIEQLAARFADPGADGTWTGVVLALVDLQDRPDADPPPGSPA